MTKKLVDAAALAARKLADATKEEEATATAAAAAAALSSPEKAQVSLSCSTAPTERECVVYWYSIQ